MAARRGALRAPLFIAAVLVVVAVSRGCGDDGASSEPAGPVSVRVTHVVDGDTIDVAMPDGDGETVRYIGIDTPETVKPDTPVECGGPRAHAVNERLVGGRTVTLRFDAERRDVYGRLLAYVYVPRDGPGNSGTSGSGEGNNRASGSGERPLFVNAELVRRGLARTLTIPPNDSFASLFARLAARAGALGWGLWGRCPL